MPSHLKEQQKEENRHKPHPPKPHGKPKPHEKKKHHLPAGLALSPAAKDVLQKIFVDPVTCESVGEELAQEGPDHKQLHTALLIESAARLLETVEKQTKKKFASLQGEKVISQKQQGDHATTVIFPSAALTMGKKEEVTEILSGAPLHELISFSTLLQVMEWANGALR